ncbi:MAG: hypothetical protein M1820_006588 [Bogoriella megaspora]|nr:MAG: hypothetical protein M1820_006588 [Bogoriella megaspora]
MPKPSLKLLSLHILIFYLHGILALSGLSEHGFTHNATLNSTGTTTRKPVETGVTSLQRSVAQESSSLGYGIGSYIAYGFSGVGALDGTSQTSTTAISQLAGTYAASEYGGSGLIRGATSTSASNSTMQAGASNPTITEISSTNAQSSLVDSGTSGASSSNETARSTQQAPSIPSAKQSGSVSYSYHIASPTPKSLSQVQNTIRNATNTTNHAETTAMPTLSCYSIGSWGRNASSSRKPSPTRNAFNLTGNANLDQCWMQWSDYWDFEQRAGRTELSEYEEQTQVWESACVQRWPVTDTSYASIAPNIYTDTVTQTHTIVADGFTQTTEVTTYIWTNTEWVATGTLTPLTTITSTHSQTVTDGSIADITVTGGKAPECELPNSMPQCQASWDKWASLQVMATPTVSSPLCGEPGSCQLSWKTYDSAWSSYSSIKGSASPRCTQASIGAPLCDSLRSSYVAAGSSENNAIVTDGGGGTRMSGGYVQTAAPYGSPSNDSADGLDFGLFGIAASQSYLPASWPSSSTLAAGCTLGCGKCAVTGGTVQLIYWPPATAAARNQTNTSLTPRAASGLVVASTLGTVLTSPTVYISLADVHAADSCSVVGRTHSHTILPLTATDQLSSIWAQYQGGLSTASFNFDDLNTPIAESVYTRQPWCAQWTSSQSSEDLNFGACNGTVAFWGDQNTCYPTCPQTRPFNPILVLPSSFLNNVDPQWSSCTLEQRGVYDPPIFLTPQTAAAHPTPVPETTSTDVPAQPASVVPSRTAGTPTPTPHTVSAVPDPPDNRPASPGPASIRPAPAATSQGSAAASNIISALEPPPKVPISSSAASPLPSNAQQTDRAKPSAVVDPSSAAGGVLSLLDPSPSSLPTQAAADPTNNHDNPDHPLPTYDPSVATQIAGQASGDPPDPSMVISGTAPQPGATSPIQGTSASAENGAQVVTESGSANIPAEEGQPTSPAAITVGHQPVYSDPSGSGVIVGQSTLRPGASTVIQGTSVVVGNGGQIIVGSSTVNIPAGTNGAAPPVATSIGAQPVHADPNGPGVVVGASTLNPGRTTVVAGTPLSIGTSGIIVAGSSTINLPTASAQPPDLASASAINSGSGDPNNPTTPQASAAIVTLGGQTYTAKPGQPLIVGSSTIAAGGPAATVSGQTISMGSAGVNVGGNEVAFSSSYPSATVEIGGQKYTVSAGKPLVIGGSMISPNGPAATIAGQAVSLGSDGVQVDGQTTPFTQDASNDPGAIVTIGDQIYTAQWDRPLVVGSATLTAGGSAAVVSGRTISMANSGIVINGHTEGFSSTATPTAVFTLGSSLVTATPGQPLVVGTETLTAGGSAAVVSGQTISMANSGIVINGNTEVFSSAPATRAVFTLGSSLVTATPGQPLVIGTETLTAGGSALTTSGETISLGSSGVIVDGSTVVFSSSDDTFMETEAPFTISGTAYTGYALGSGIEVIAGPSGFLTTISVSGPAATIAGQTISAESGAIEVGTSRGAFRTEQASVEQEAVFTAGGKTSTAVESPAATGSGDVAVIDGSITLSVGGPASVVAGDTVSFGSSGLVINGTLTEPLTSVTLISGSSVSIPSAALPTSSQGIGNDGETNGNGEGSGAMRAAPMCVTIAVFTLCNVFILLL